MLIVGLTLYININVHAATYTMQRAGGGGGGGWLNVTSQGPKIIARSFSIVTKENTLRVNCTSPLDLLTDGLFTYYYVYRLKLTQIEYSRYRSKYLK